MLDMTFQVKGQERGGLKLLHSMCVDSYPTIKMSPLKSRRQIFKHFTIAVLVFKHS